MTATPAATAGTARQLAQPSLHFAAPVAVGCVEDVDSDRCGPLDHAIRFRLDHGAVAVAREAPCAERQLGDLDAGPAERSRPHGADLHQARAVDHAGP